MVRYLGVQVEIDLALKLHVLQLLLTLTKKLFLRSHAKLSLASRVIVANHVLLLRCDIYHPLGSFQNRALNKFEDWFGISYGRGRIGVM
mgnify:CR=1 FL=1